jgi:hypothetical protein
MHLFVSAKNVDAHILEDTVETFLDMIRHAIRSDVLVSQDFVLRIHPETSPAERAACYAALTIAARAVRVRFYEFECEALKAVQIIRTTLANHESFECLHGCPSVVEGPAKNKPSGGCDQTEDELEPSAAC